MSAFIVADSVFQKLADSLAQEYGTYKTFFLPQGPTRAIVDPITRATAAVNDWQKANHMAVASRYRSEADNFDPIAARFSTKLPAVQLYKSLQCLHYQCSETVSGEHEEWHAAMMEEMEAVLASIAAHIVNTLPEYEAAKWG